MFSRRTLMKYTGLAWLGSLFVLPDGGSEQLPTDIAENPWDTHLVSMVPGSQRLMPGDAAGPLEILWRQTQSWLPKDGQTVLLATNGGGPHLWVATFYAATESTLHGNLLYTDWHFVTMENNNEIFDGDLGNQYLWMPLPESPYADDWDHNDDLAINFWSRAATNPRSEES